MSAHVSLRKRLTRLVGRTVGLPFGTAIVMLLRLSARRAGVALMYHSVEERAGDPSRELVPPHEVGLFERQLRHVRRHYEVVPADRLLEAVQARRRGQRFPVAITFDDDLTCHASVALPVLQRTGLTATFFLSGASLERPFAFHFERLQRAADEGLPELAAVVTGTPGQAGPSSAHELSRLIESMAPEDRDAAAERLGAALGPDPTSAGIRAEDVRRLADAGMTIGFHTFKHYALRGLTDMQLAEALETGRSALAHAAGAPIDTIGYPHGSADERVGSAARAAGFRAGFTTRRGPVTPHSDPLLQGRIGPSLHSVGGLALELAVTLLKRGSERPSPAPEPRAS